MNIRNELDDGFDFVIGVMPSTDNLSSICKDFFCFHQGKGFIALQGTIWQNDRAHTKYGIACNTNDIIDMELNMNESYMLNIS